jgi:hypothetical protein
MFVVFAQTAAASLPGESALNDPTSGGDREALLSRVAFDDFERDVEGFTHPGSQTGATTDAVCPDMLRGGRRLLEQFQEWSGAMINLNVGCVDNNGQQVAQGIGGNVPFATLDLFGCVVAAYIFCCGGLHALAVDDGCAYFAFAALLLEA